MSDTNKTDAQNVKEAIAKAKEVQKAKAAAAESNAPVKTTAPRAKLSETDRKARQEKLEAEKAQKKLAREAIRAQKNAERERAAEVRKSAREAKKVQKALEKAKAAANRPPAHMSKVQKAAAKLPLLDEKLSETVANLVEDMSVSELSRVIAHLQHANRVTQTLASHEVCFEEGQQVRIMASEFDASLIGQVGTVTEMRKIRVLLEVEGVNKPVYLFAADCEGLEQLPQEKVQEDEGSTEGTEVDEEGFLSVEDATGTDNK